MRFTLLDRIADVEIGKRITATKSLSLAEEYLADHFPHAPVMPGVLMLEAMVQASAWLVRHSEHFAHSMVLLKEVRGVKYGSFVEPGQALVVTAEVLSHGERETRLKTQGTIDGAVAVSARMVLERYNLSDTDAAQAATDAFLVARLR